MSSSEYSYGAVARLDALLAGHPEWYAVSQWPLKPAQKRGVAHDHREIVPGCFRCDETTASVQSLNSELSSTP